MLFEVTDFCNLRCIMCSHDYSPGPHKMLKGFMAPEVFRHILFSVPPRDVPWTIKLFWLGEPLLHPQFDLLLSIAGEYIEKIDSQAGIDIHTNGICLDRYVQQLNEMENQLAFLTISLDALTNEAYSKIRKGSVSVEQVNHNVRQFVRRRKKMGQNKPSVILQFILMEENQEEVFDFISYWTTFLKNHGNMADQIYIKKKDLHFCERQQEYDIFYQQFITELSNRKWSDFLKVDGWQEFKTPPGGEDEKSIPTGIKPLPCCAPWKTPVVNHNGDLTVCCFDSFFDLKLGSLLEKSFSELWFSNRMETFRKMIYFHEYDRIETTSGKKRCCGCTHIPWPKWSETELKVMKLFYEK